MYLKSIPEGDFYKFEGSCPKVGRGSGLPRRISVLARVARRLRTNYFKIHLELSELVAASQRCNSDEISLGIMYRGLRDRTK